MLFASLKLAQALMEYFSSHSMWMEYMGRGGVWAATTRSSDYVRMEGTLSMFLARELELSFHGRTKTNHHPF